LQRAGIMSWPRLVLLCVDACPVGGGPVSHCGVGAPGRLQRAFEGLG